MKKVAFFVTSLNAGGIENYLLRFLRFSEGRIKPFVICKGGTFGELSAQYQQIKGVELIRLKTGYLNPWRLYQVYQFFKNNRIDSVCDFTGNFAGLILLVSRSAGIKKRIVFYRGSSNHFKESYFRLKYNNQMLRLVKQNATKILSNSGAAFDYFYPERSGSDVRFRILYNGVDPQIFTVKKTKEECRKKFNIPLDAFVIGHTGRYNSAKNHITVARVANELCHKYPDIFFVICGKNTELFKREAVLLYPLLSEKLIALGYQDNVPEVLKAFDLFFFPSLTEGQPNALIEAMLAGLPVVASNIPSIKETTPAALYPSLKEPADASGFVEQIENIYLHKECRQKFIYSDWAAGNFDPAILFDAFFAEL